MNQAVGMVYSDSVTSNGPRKNSTITLLIAMCTLLVGVIFILGYIAFLRPSEGLQNFFVGANGQVKGVEKSLDTNSSAEGNVMIQSTTTNQIIPPVQIVATSTKAQPQHVTQEVQNTSQNEGGPTSLLETFAPAVSGFAKTVVLLECFGVNDTEPSSGGSGVSFYDASGNHYIATNAHVVRAYDGSFGGCWVYFPGDKGYFYDTAYWAGVGYLYDDVKIDIDGTEYGGSSYADGGLDYAMLELTEPGEKEDGTFYPTVEETKFPDAQSESEKTCRHAEFELGDKVLVLGYPGIGGSSLTITDGIVSGFDGYFDENIKISAKVDHGNSGGLAVRASDGCLIGIPSMGMVGEMETLSSVIRYSFIDEFISIYSADENIISDARNDSKPSLDTISLYPEIQWKKQNNPHKTFVKNYGDSLVFDDVCDGYSLGECARYRSISLPNSTGDVFYENIGKEEVIQASDWKQEYIDVVEYYDSRLKAIGFTRNQFLYVPDRGLAIPVFDYSPEEYLFDGGTFLFARVNGDKLEVVSLSVRVEAENLDSCETYQQCKLRVKESTGLFMSGEVPLDKFVSYVPSVQRFATTDLRSDYLASVMGALKGIFKRDE